MKTKTLIKTFILNLILFLIIIPKSFTKPIPPGSGEGDVPANILILLDSSVSMRNIVSGGMGTYGIDWAVELSDGNIIFAENGRGFSKILSADGARDVSFAKNAINFRGSNNDPDCGTNSKVNKSWAGDVTSNDVVYGLSTQGGGQIVAINSSGVCVEVIGFNKTKIAMPALLEIREIDNEEILFVGGRTHEGGGKKGKLYVKNLTTGAQKRCSINNGQYFGSSLAGNKAMSMTISNNGDYIYLARGQSLFGFELSKDGNNLYCPTDGNWDYYINTGRNRVQSPSVQNSYTDDIKDIYSIKYSDKTKALTCRTSSFFSGDSICTRAPYAFKRLIKALEGTSGTNSFADPSTANMAPSDEKTEISAD